MRYTAADLRNEIKSGIKGPYLIYGNEEYYKNFYCGRIKIHALSGAEDFAEWNTREIEATPDNFRLDELEEAISSVPMMAEKVFVLYRCKFNLPKEKEKEEKKPDNKKENKKTKKEVFNENLEALLSLVSTVDNTVTCLVIFVPDGGFDGDSKKPDQILKKMEAALYTVPLDSPTPGDVDAWIERRMKKENINMALDARIYFRERASLGMFLLSSEMDKLVCYAGANDKKLIDLALVKEVSSLTDVSENFGLSNAIVAGDRRKALNELYLSKLRMEPSQQIFGGVISNITSMLIIKAMMDEGFTKDAIAEKTKMHAFRVSKLMEGVRHLEYGRLLAAQKRLYDADLLRKTTGQDDYILLERFICTMPSGKK